MIRVICLNPVVDRMYYIGDFSPGRQYKEIAPQLFAGGKGVNTARVISQLGERCCLYGFLGGANGRLVEQDMRRYGVELHPFYTTGETRTTINIIDRAARRETEITEPSVPVTSEDASRFLAELETDLRPGDLVVCSGIPMASMEPGIYGTISALARAKGAFCALDANSQYLRASFPGQYSFAKPNTAELCELFAEPPDWQQAQTLRLARRMSGLGVERVLVSTGRTGGVLVHNDRCLYASVPDLPVRSTIGSSDATVAGFCVAMSRGLPDADALKLAMACGVCNALFSQVGYVEKDRVEQLVREIRVREQSDPPEDVS